jgi:hypothetical protein
MMSGLCEHHRRRQQHEAIDAVGEFLRCEDRERAAQARSDQRDGIRPVARQRAAELIEHTRQRHGLKIRFVEVGTDERDAVRTQPLGEVSGLRRLRGRGEPVQIVDGRLHNSV